MPKPAKYPTERMEAPADSGKPAELGAGNHQPRGTPEQVREAHDRNQKSFIEHTLNNPEFGEAMLAINSSAHLDVQRLEVIWHALADLPPDVQVVVARDLAARPGAQAELGKASREQVAAVIHQVGQRFAHQRAEEVVNQGFRSRVAQARKRYADFDAVALNKQLPTPIKHGGVIDLFVATEEHGTDVLYHLAKNPKVLAEISKLNPFQQHRRLIEIESRVTAGPPRTSAPRPPSEVGGRGTGWGDGEESALARNDYRAVKAVWNKRAIKEGKL
jgi:hypothetical protein